MYENIWKKCRDVTDGEDAVKLNREYYLPKPAGMSEAEYSAYLNRAEFFNATGRTLDGLHGMMFRKDVVIEVPEAMRQYLENVDGKGTDMKQFIAESSYLALRYGWGGVHLDAPNASNIKTKREAEDMGIVPYLRYYSAMDIFNWHYAEQGRYRKFDYVCLHEKEQVRRGSDFGYDLKDKYRILFIDETGNYRLVVKNSEGGTVADDYPKKNGKPFDHITFKVLPNIEPEKPMLIDLVNLNLAWYRKSADLENGAHWTGVPTPYVLGYEPETEYYTDEKGNTQEKAREDIYLGGSKMLTFPQGVSGIGYLEFAGAGLSQLQNMMTQDEDRMAILGARIISAEKRGVESAETARIHRAGENSVLATFANNLSNVFKDIIVEYLGWCTESEVNPDDVTVRINTDYDTARMNPTELQALVSLWQSGGISKKQLFNNMKDGEIVDSEITFEEMEDEIEAEKETSSREPFNASDEFDEEKNDEE